MHINFACGNIMQRHHSAAWLC